MMGYTQEEKETFRTYFAAIVNGIFSSYNVMATNEAIEVAAYFATLMLEEERKIFNKKENNC